MKNIYSYLSCILISIALIAFRIGYTESNTQLPIKVTTWDALGYYLYLPSTFIYHDEENLHWFPKIDSSYQLSGGSFYQANKLENGNYVFKYLEGVSILELPGFLIAHAYALHSNYPADGFSAPYQYGVAWSCILFCILSIFLLRRILLVYFSDKIVSVTLIAGLLSSNFIQYCAIDSGQSHGFIFPLYMLLIYVTMKWHQTFHFKWSILIGLIIGIAAISRPTEVIMIFIPLCWNIYRKQDFIDKLNFLKRNPIHIILIVLSILIAISPQLIYWKRVTGSWIYDVGSKWDFLDPHWRVLIGFEKGWFVYTPITLLFVAGFFFMKGKPFQRSILIFCLLNIYIIIAWHIWRYGGSYSCRALVQSYPVFMFAFASFTSYILASKFRWIFLIGSSYLIGVNLIQIVQYNRGIIHYDDMNFKYYKAIYLKLYPSPLDMSLLDTEDYLTNATTYTQQEIYSNSNTQLFNNHAILFKGDSIQTHQPKWFRIDTKISKLQNMWGAYLTNSYPDHDTIAIKRIRLFNAISKEDTTKFYSYYLHLPDSNSIEQLKISVDGYDGLSVELNNISITSFQ